MSMPRISPSTLLFSSLVVIAFMASIESTQAKRIRSGLYLRGREAIKTRRGGCSAFGHTCFGGHGKRSDPTSNPSEQEEIPVGLQSPSSEVGAFLMSNGARQEIFSRDQGQLDSNDLSFFQQQQQQPQYHEIDPEDLARIAFVKKLLARYPSYRRDLQFGIRK